MDIGVQEVYLRGIASLTLMWERKEERMSRGEKVACDAVSTKAEGDHMVSSEAGMALQNGPPLK